MRLPRDDVVLFEGHELPCGRIIPPIMSHMRAVRILCQALLSLVLSQAIYASDEAPAKGSPNYQFDRSISREVLENYLARSITMEGLLNGRGDFDDNIRMLKSIGAKFIGRSLCLWGGEGNLLRNLERARQQFPKVHEADPDMVLQACI